MRTGCGRLSWRRRRLRVFRGTGLQFRTGLENWGQGLLTLFKFREDGGGDLAGGGFGVVVGFGEDVGGDFDDDGAAVVQAV